MLLLPALLALAQFSGTAIVSSSPLTPMADVLTIASPLPKGPAVLGAAIDARGQTAAKAKIIIPQLTAEDLTAVSAKSFLIYDRSDGDLPLAQRAAGQKLSIASLTKLMTGLLAYDRLDFGRTVTVDKTKLTAIRPIVNFLPDDKVPVGDVFNAMIVGSCNDAALVLAQSIGQSTGEDAVRLMNERARQLGMTQTSFANPVGFDSQDNYSTALDLQKLVNETQKFAAFANLGRLASVSFKGNSGFNYFVPATNSLIKNHSDIQSIKTGFTRGAQGAMISRVAKNGRDIVIIVLGSQDRERDTLLLKNLVVDKLAWQ